MTTIAAGEPKNLVRIGSDVEKTSTVASVDTPRPITSVSGASNQSLEGWRLATVIFTLLFGLFLSTVETSITATALVEIGEHFKDSYTANWVVLGYLLSYMGFSVIFARLSDAIGRKPATLAAWFFFAVFSLASGLATSLKQLIVFRVLQGIGGAGLFCMCMILVPTLTPTRLWGLISGLVGMAFACSAIVGPVLGGVITQRAGWRWIYLFNAPAAAVMMVPFWLAWPNSHIPTHRKLLPLKEIDVPGAALLLAASTLLLFALQQAGISRWDSPAVIASLVIGSVCWVSFFIWCWFLEFGTSNLVLKPILPLSIALPRPTGPAIIAACLAGVPFFTVVYNLPIRFQLVNGDSPIMAGVHLLPLLGASAFGSGLGGGLNKTKNRTAPSLIIASVLMAISTGLLSNLPANRTIERIQYFYQSILGLGAGLGFAAITVMITLSNSAEDNACANGAIQQARVLGGCIGLAVATIILNDYIANDLQNVLTPAEILQLRKSLTTINSLEAAQRFQVARVFAKSFNEQMRMCMYASIACVLISLLTWQRNPPHPQNVEDGRTGTATVDAIAAG